MMMIEDFMKLVKETWNQGLRGIGIDEIIFSIGVLLVALILRSFLSSKVVDWISTKTSQTDTELDDEILESLRKPLGLVPIAFGLYIIASYLPLEGTLEMISTNLLKMLIIYTIFRTFSNLIQPLLSLLNDSWMTAAMADWLRKTAVVIIWAIAIAMMLDVWGVQIAPIIAGLGLFGVALALGAQDVFKNIFAGIFILSENRFQKGDRIRVGNSLHGIVDQIGFRSTKVRLFDTSPVFVPNADLSDAQLVNHQMMEVRRIDWTVNLVYNTSIDQLKKICSDIEKFLLQNKDFPADLERDNFVKVQQLGESSIDLKVLCHTEAVGFLRFSEIKEDLIFIIIDSVKKNGSDFAFPSRSVYLENSD
tara:strand:- start:733 stop:1821 length:1089 start_codon:yes stop_codon:yes gene_type:complete